jgi:hypothetical protein
MADADYDALLASLQELTSAPSGGDFTRANLIALLDVLTNHLGKALATQLGELEDGTHVELEHPVVNMLEGLSSALGDLDNGLTDTVLKRVGGTQNARRPWRLRQEDDVLIEAVEIFKRVKKTNDIKATCRLVARELNRHKHRRRGKKLTGRDVYNIYYRYKYQ